MIKNRSFMMGLGTGLVAGAVLLQLMIIGEQGAAEPEAEQPEWTQASLEEAAETLNLRVVDEDENLMTEEEWHQQSKEDQADNPADEELPAEPKQPDKPKQPENPAGEQTSNPAVPPAEPAEPKPAVITYTIRNGSNLDQVATGLERAGVVEDKNAFLRAAAEQGLSKRIQQGTYTFTEGENIGSIINKIAIRPSQ